MSCYFLNMKFENKDGKPVEINFQNFEKVLPGEEAGLTHVKFKDGTKDLIKATAQEIIEATAEE
jgi:hypothetical protein